MPLELLAMHVYVPASEICEGEMSRLPDSRRVNLGSWTEPLAKTCSPEKKERKQVSRWKGHRSRERRSRRRRISAERFLDLLLGCKHKKPGTQ